MKSPSVIGALAAIAAALAVPAMTSAASFANGSFEGFAGSFTEVGAGSNAINGWVVGANGIDWIGTYFAAADGDASVDLNASHGAAGPGGSISQTFDTIANHRYIVRFRFAGNPTVASVCPTAEKTMTVHATGGGTSSYSFDTSGRSVTDMGWVTRTYSFHASGPSATLTYQSTTLGNCGPAVDRVVVTDAGASNPVIWRARGAIQGPCGDPLYRAVFDNRRSTRSVIFHFRFHQFSGGWMTVTKRVAAGRKFTTNYKHVLGDSRMTIVTGSGYRLATKRSAPGGSYGKCP